MTVHMGGCHCGAVRFQIELAPDEREVLDCNCSICSKKGFLHLIVPDERFKMLQGSEQLVDYTFGTGIAHHLFCKVCGIHACYRPRSHPDAWDVNVRCLDELPLSHWTIRVFDGVNWERSIETIR